jgi:hypothetical protein
MRSRPAGLDNYVGLLPYVKVVRRSVLDHSKREPKRIGVAFITQYLSNSATGDQLAAATQGDGALDTILFLHRKVLEI